MRNDTSIFNHFISYCLLFLPHFSPQWQWELHSILLCLLHSTLLCLAVAPVFIEAIPWWLQLAASLNYTISILSQSSIWNPIELVKCSKSSAFKQVLNTIQMLHWLRFPVLIILNTAAFSQLYYRDFTLCLLAFIILLFANFSVHSHLRTCTFNTLHIVISFIIIHCRVIVLWSLTKVWPIFKLACRIDFDLHSKSWHCCL